MVEITQEVVQAIQMILERGNTAEIKKLKDGVTVLEAKRKKKVTIPVCRPD